MSAVFGEVSEELLQKSKYSKWRAAYIIKCIKNNEQPLPPEDEEKSNDDVLQPNVLQPTEPSAGQNSNLDFGVGQPPAFNDNFNLNQINKLSIQPDKPSSATSITTNYSDYASQSSTSNTNDLSPVAMSRSQFDQQFGHLLNV